MSEDYLIRHCAPTLAGIKTANLFTCPYQDRKDLLDSVRQMTASCTPRGCGSFPSASRLTRR